jgi:hypothetical protein
LSCPFFAFVQIIDAFLCLDLFDGIVVELCSGKTSGHGAGTLMYNRPVHASNSGRHGK